MAPTVSCVVLALIGGAAALDDVAFSSEGKTKAAAALVNSGSEWPTATAAAAAGSSMSVDIDVSEELKDVTNFLMGTNIPVYNHPDDVNDQAVTMLDSGIGFMRYPGGSPANEYLWDSDYSTYPYFSTWNWMDGKKQTHMADFVQYINNTGATPLVQLNAALALVYGADVAAEYFIAEHEAFLALGLDVQYYEFGNENYGSWEPPYGDYPVNGTLYAEAFVTVATAMKAKYPHLLLGPLGMYSTSGVAHSRTVIGKDGHPIVGTIIANFFEDCLQTEGFVENADWLDVHEYFYKTQSDDKPSDEVLLSTVDEFATIAQGVQDFYTAYAPTATLPPLAFGEYNIVQKASGGCGALLQFINVLWHAEVFGEAATGASGFSSLMSFAWADGSGACEYTSRGAKATYGKVTRDDPDGVADGTPTPSLYAYSLFARAMGQTTVANTVSVESEHVRAYSSVFEGGEVGLILVNDDTESFDALEVTVATGYSVKAANAWLVTASDNKADSDAPDSEALGVVWNAEEDPALPSAVKPYYVEADADGKVIVSLPAYSMVALVMYDHTEDETTDDDYLHPFQDDAITPADDDCTPLNSQCGGLNLEGCGQNATCTECCEGICTYGNEYYWKCKN